MITLRQSGPIIGHVDGDAFYVEAERVRDRYLRGKPVGVISNQGYFVIAKSNEMKRLGITTGEPLPDALKKCPDGIYVKRDFAWYEVVSKRMFECLKNLSPCVEYYSIDELFFTVPRGAEPQAFAEKVRDTILEEVGVPSTVGISRSRTLAKLIGDTGKPFGAVAICDPTKERELLAEFDVAEVSGIAGRRARRLLASGIQTCLDYANADPRLIRQILTVVGLKLWHELNGEAVEPIHTTRPRHKIISRGGSIGRASADPRRVWGFLIRNLERFIEALQFHKLLPARLALYLQYRDTERSFGSTPLSPTDRFDVLLEEFRYCWQRCWLPGHLATRMHLFGTDLHGENDIQHGLFDPPDAHSRALAIAKHKINERLGRFMLRSGQTLFLNDIYTDEANNYESCDIQGKTVF
jgi:DNA polymerase V